MKPTKPANRMTRIWHAGILAAALAVVFAIVFGGDIARSAYKLASIAPGDASKALPGLKKQPVDPNAEFLNLIACMAAFHDENYPRAESYCAQAVRINPTNPGSRKMLGAVYLMESRYSDAELHFSAAIALDPADPDTYAGRGFALRGLGRFADAGAAFGSAIHLAPGDAQLWNARCWTRAAGDIALSDALADCDQAIKLVPNYASAYDSRGFTNLRLNRNAAAVKDYSAAIRLRPRFASALFGRGIARDRLRQYSAGARDRAAAHKIDPAIDALYASYGFKPAARPGPRHDGPAVKNPSSASLDWDFLNVLAAR